MQTNGEVKLKDDLSSSRGAVHEVMLDKESTPVIDQATNLQQTKSAIVENNDEASQNCDSKVISLNPGCELETAGSDMAIGCLVQPQILISGLEPSHSSYMFAKETKSLIKEKEACQEMGHIEAVQVEESFSQIGATETGSLIQEGEALGAKESLVKETFHQSIKRNTSD